MSRALLMATGAMALAFGCCALPVSAAAFTEYFNGYGTTASDLSGKTGGAGWNAPWAGDVGPDYASLTQNAAYNLTYTATGYSNAGNGSALSDGAATTGGGNAANVATRAVGTTADTGLTGTIWMSCLVNSGTSGTADMLLWVDRPDASTNSYVAIRNLTARLRYAGADLTGSANEYALSTTYLLLAKVVVNASGTNDTLEMWINPNLSGGEAGLGAPKLSGANNSNAFGNAFSGIGVSFEDTGKLDAIRLSNDADGFYDVTLVPEPGAAGLIGAAVLLLGKRRRRV